MDLCVDEVMRAPVVTVALDARLNEAHDRMVAHGIRHLIVVDELGLVGGVLSDRDIRSASASRLTWADEGKRMLFLRSYRVRDVAALQPIRVAAGTPVRDAVQLMRRAKVGCLPVTELGRPVGVLTGTDLLDLLLRMLDGTR